MARGREFQIVGAATAKLREPKHVRTRGVRRTQGTRWSVMFQGLIEVGRLGSMVMQAILNLMRHSVTKTVLFTNAVVTMINK